MRSPFEAPLKWEELPPVPAVAGLAERLRGVPGAFLLESGLEVGGMGQWHIFGGYPIGEAQVVGNRWRWELPGQMREGKGNPFREVEGWWRSFAIEAQGPVRLTEIGIPFTGGAVGYLGFELADHLERLPAGHATGESRHRGNLFVRVAGGR